MKETIHLKAGARLALLLGIPVLIGLLMSFVAREASHRADAVKHTLLVELSLERLLSDLKDAETGQRSYLLTGEATYLEPYHAASRETRRELATLHALTYDNPRQQQVIARIQPLLDSRLVQFDGNLELDRAGVDFFAQRAGIDGSKAFMDSVRLLTAEMHGEEERLLQLRELALTRISRIFSWSLAAGYGLIVVVVGSLHRGVNRFRRQSMEAEEQFSRLNADLDQRVQERTALLKAREELLSIFVKHVPAAVAMLDRNMTYLQVSDRWCTDYSVQSSQLMGRSHYEVFPDLPERWKEIHRRCLSGETQRAEEDRWDRADGGSHWMYWEIRPWGNRDGLPEGILIFVEDITESKQVEEMLRESEATTRALLENAAQAILAIDAGGLIVLANQMAGTMFGYAPGKVLGEPLEILLPERLRARHTTHRAEFFSNPRTRPMGLGAELVGLRQDGSEFPIEVSLSSVDTIRGPLAVSFVSDITVRKRAEAALRTSEQQLRALAGDLLNAQEDERRRLSRELHDDITQRLAFLSIELGKLVLEAPDSPGPVEARIRTLQEQTLQMSQEVRRLSHGLHPSVIEDFGLSVALEEFCQEFGKSQGIDVTFEGFVEDSRLNTAAATCLYRVAQESLRNAAIHGQATEVRVDLSADVESIQLRVRDNGAGFLTDDARAKIGLGLISMKERIRLVRGTFILSSELGQGTDIIATVPLEGVGNEAGAHSAG